MTREGNRTGQAGTAHRTEETNQAGRSGHLELFAEGLHFPTSLTFDDEGNAYVAESGLPFAGAPPGGRVWRMQDGGKRSLLADGLEPPVNGLVWYHGTLIVSEANRITRLALDGGRTVVVDGLPGPGNYHTNMVVIGPDGWLYFSQGAMTNSGIVGLDAYEVGWLRRLPHAHDLPGYGVVLAGVNAETANPVEDRGIPAATGAFSPFATPTAAGQRIAASVPCTAGVMRCRPDGTGLETVAWGLRNAFGLGFLPDGRLLAVDQGADDRGSRPIGDAPDLLFEVRPRAWYGWPDFVDGIPVTDKRFRPERGPAPAFLLTNHGELPTPERARLRFPPHTAAVKFDVAPPTWRARADHLYVALFGDERPMTAPAGPRAGRCVSRVNPQDWTLEQVVTGPLFRPIDVRFHPNDHALHIVDFGWFEMGPNGVSARAGSGAVWRIEGKV
jgi:glucose/arabinose dehydrogenase